MSLATSLKQRLIEQFHKPRGPLGRLAGQIMARRGSNIERNLATIELLDLSPGERVLEVGYGPGVAMEELAKRVPGGLVTGVDHSPTMHDAAARRIRRAGLNHRVELLVGDANALGSVAPGPFDAVMGVNVWMFWPDPEAVMRDLHERLLPGGRIALTYQPRHSGATDADTQIGAEELAAHLEAAGFIEVTLHTLDLAGVPAAVATAYRSPSMDTTRAHRADPVRG